MHFAFLANDLFEMSSFMVSILLIFLAIFEPPGLGAEFLIYWVSSCNSFSSSLKVVRS
jgi:hypothetical protein